MWEIDLAVLFVQYDRDRHPGAFERIKRYVERLRFCAKTYIVIDNKNEGAPLEKIAESTYRVGGDNSAWEFSGWQRGVEALGEIRARYQVVLFLTEAVLAPGRTFLERYGTKSLLMSYFLRSAVGRLDWYESPGGLLGKSVDNWLCTSCVFMPRKVMEGLGTLVTVDEKTMDLFMDRHYRGEVFKPDAPLDERYKAFLVDWLTRRRYQTFTINNETWEKVRGKIRSMFNEALLTIRIREKGFPVRSYGSKKYY